MRRWRSATPRVGRSGPSAATGPDAGRARLAAWSVTGLAADSRGIAVVAGCSRPAGLAAAALQGRGATMTRPRGVGSGRVAARTADSRLDAGSQAWHRPGRPSLWLGSRGARGAELALHEWTLAEQADIGAICSVAHPSRVVPAARSSRRPRPGSDHRCGELRDVGAGQPIPIPDAALFPALQLKRCLAHWPPPHHFEGVGQRM
jgi:hypothetical protein